MNFYTDRGELAAEPRWIDADGAGPQFSIDLSPELFRQADGYLRLEIRVWRGDKAAPRTAAFHLRAGGGKDLRLVGIVH